MKITAKAIVELLAAKHHKDVFFDEVKDGPTWNAAPCRMDAWAMVRSWTQPCLFGYEVKVSRADFLGDDKWPAYLPYCNRFAFVTPPGLIKEGELPPEVGLLHVTKTGSRLYTKKKAPHRQVDVPTDLFLYLLMSRTVPGQPRFSGMQTDQQYWNRWLEDREFDYHFGQRVSGEIRRAYESEMSVLQSQNRGLVSENKELRDIKVMCDELGISPSKWTTKRDIEEAVDEAQREVPKIVRRLINRIDGDMGRLVGQVKTLVEQAGGGA